jgi:PAS domain S-box-containing protein
MKTMEPSNPLNTHPDADRLSMALNAAQMGMWDWNIATGEINWSPEHEQLFGLAPGTFDGTYDTFDRCLHPDDRESIKQAVSEALAHQMPYHHEYRVVWADGSIHWIEGRGQALYDAAGNAIRMLGTVMAIDGRKQAEAALKEQKSIQQLFALYAPAGIAMFDRQMRYLMASQRWIDEYMLNPIESLVGQSHYEIFPDIPEHWRAIHRRCLAGAIEKCEDERWVRADGSDQWISWEIRPWHTASGSIGGIIIFSVENTQRKQAEIALQQLNAELEQRVVDRTAELTQVNADLQAALAQQQQSQQEIEDLYNNAPCGYHSLDAQGRLVQINDTELGWLGYDRQEILHQKFTNFLTSESQQRFKENFPIFKRQGWINNLEFQIVAKDGSIRDVNLTASTIRDQAGNFVMSRSSLFNVSDRKRAEAALSQSEDKFRQLAENIQDVFWITDATNQHLLYVSPAYETLWGSSRESLYQNPRQWLDAIHPEDRSRVAQTLREQSAQGHYDHEYRVIHANGTMRWIRDRAFPIKNEAGEIIRLVGIAEDITERQRIEEIKNEFISIVSHELRTPLTAIQMSLGLLKTGIYANHSEKFQRMLTIAYQDTHRLVNLVNDILDLERLESGRATLERTVCQANDLMQQAIDGVQAIATQQNITLVLHPAPQKVWAAYDPVIQTLTNLLSNAIKFSPAHSQVHLSAVPQNQQVLFQVRDQGRGIPADKLEAIFGRFQQVDASDAREKGGTGLGLPICRSIIEQQGGKIWAESAIGEGSTFFFTLPSSTGGS